ncbi:histidinol dehydrogenase [Aneurinibacillus aneurinilyticus]|nr:histidinol dehydrogenase [Aneurinibacillus aneurinilyticus]MCI1693917.1 histidinol dehydrogenase [Aneurinibacillus aneurinilyticus]MED0706501.1 histidinol dehydrogenase [Aneurinibacillus aneurinilyticus]MED0721424.1 histidinol dehydrogenase [Aneurinibacillus aneurinilyticus]MED0731150.1 histidinol dehydrogenase [Aneurinibacillus aneurinilyticus]MED0743282.1 histidinol dehydrogenase [Aneurinibacillus aneurinilyticus]
MKIVDAANFSTRRDVETGTETQRAAVLDILQAVKQEGDAAVRRFTEQFDRIQLPEMRVTEDEFKEALCAINPEVRDAIREAAVNIRDYHSRQMRQSWMTTHESGTVLGQLIRPLQRVGLYVPGGTAAYPSSVLMNAIPAQVAGVEEIAMVTPPGKDGKVNPGVLVAAYELGVNEIYKVGGAQAIAALTYGTETLKPVDKIVGPGNIYVALAKREVFGLVDIDMVAGPSEIVVLADSTANPAYVAADLLSQAEHDVMASAVLVTTCRELAQAVQQEVETQVAVLPRKEIAQASIQDYGAICVVDSMEEGLDVVNRLAPEHLELMIEEPMAYVGQIKNAGAIFLGPYSSEPVGDYFAGTNHVLPTNGTARFSSPLNVDDFLKKSSLISYSRQDLLTHGQKIVALARQEGLEAHARAIQIRLDNEGK